MKALLIYIALAFLISCQYCYGKDMLSDPYLDIQTQRTPKTSNAVENWKKNQHLINATLAPGYKPCPFDVGANGIYTIEVPALGSFPVYCDANIAGPGWIVIARRTNEERNFFLKWQEYKKGFGNLTSDFFIGLDKLHGITKSQTHELYIHLEDFEGQTRYAHYNDFYIESENMLYALTKVNGYTGDAGDGMVNHRGMKFSTFDNDNDIHGSENCAVTRMGAWWYDNCTDSNLFGMYLSGPYIKELNSKGMQWKFWRGVYYSYKSMHMMIRPRQ